MKITGIIWLDDVVEKIESKHHVSDKEVEEALFIGYSRLELQLPCGLVPSGVRIFPPALGLKSDASRESL